ncbi:thiol:disulfide interchange protein DsbA/DsbL [Amphibiibacter pelophylacis]|uniref:Thiol:disulfide interchange protein DsbA/DsbL n=1 Tax=Amphibiibacter pelophylacis TaxID=1799477 RepID=A0ACC6P0K6_9BURK
MNRREFVGSTAALCLVTAPLLARAQTAAAPAAGAAMSAAAPKVGVNFNRLPKPAPVSVPKGKVEVLEFFSYACPHCFHYHDAFDAWAAKVPENVVVTLVPVGFNPTYTRLQRMHYTLQALGLMNTALSTRIYNTIHVDGNRLDTNALEQAFVKSLGVDWAKYQQVTQSFAVVGKQRQAQSLMQAYKIQGTPTLGVQGLYTTDLGMTGGPEGSFAVLDYLIGRVAEGKPA